MLNEFTNLKELFQYFDDDRVCRDYLEKQRWNGSVSCVYCFRKKIYHYLNRIHYKCASCGKRFTVLKGTIFEASRIPLTSWFGAIYLYLSHKTGVSASQISRHLGISYPSAWYLHHRIMQAFVIDVESLEPVHGMWEVDEVYLTPNKNKISTKRYAKMKADNRDLPVIPIVAFYRRDGGLFGVKMDCEPTQRNVQPLLKKYIDSMSVLMTDGSALYHDMHTYFLSHEVFIHKKKEYARGMYHTNTIEGSFRHFRDTMRGYKYMSEKYIIRYWDEFCFRFNSRHMTDPERFHHFFKTVDRSITLKTLRHGQATI